MWLYATSKPEYGLWMLGVEVVLKAGLVLVIVAAGPSHPLAAYAVAAGVVALLGLFVQEQQPFLEPNANHAGACIPGQDACEVF